MKLAIRGLDVDIGERSLCRGLSLDLHGGESLAILGRNGAGKSTLLSTLAGLRPIQHGAIEIDAVSIAALSARTLARLRGYCPQQQQDAFSASVLETALVGRHPHLGRWRWESGQDVALAQAALEQLGLDEMTARDVHTLSGGERQRLALAALLVQDPQLYLLDEPLAHLDLNHAIAVLELFAARVAATQASVIAVLHDPNLARRYFQRALLLFEDGSWLEGAAADVLTQENLSRLYAHPLHCLQDGATRWFVPHTADHNNIHPQQTGE
ncbi:MAG TPA: ABC transporter ATP-binding protein [Roseateles sp.]|nr:ABC transporter ATP-binding protein [Roseateles sp.]HWT54459.1 ABC transporter ATP-binding protein [Rhodocyclaceae bacterium]